MFCPKCATQNVDGASFCRSCGANISLIPHALTGTLPQASAPDDLRSRRRRKRERDVEPSIERGILNIFIGLGFIVAALAVMFRFPAGIFWGWSFFIPGFSLLGRGRAAIDRGRATAYVDEFSVAGGRFGRVLFESKWRFIADDAGRIRRCANWTADDSRSQRDRRNHPAPRRGGAHATL